MWYEHFERRSHFYDLWTQPFDMSTKTTSLSGHIMNHNYNLVKNECFDLFLKYFLGCKGFCRKREWNRYDDLDLLIDT